MKCSFGVSRVDLGILHSLCQSEYFLSSCTTKHGKALLSVDFYFYAARHPFRHPSNHPQNLKKGVNFRLHFVVNKRQWKASSSKAFPLPSVTVSLSIVNESSHPPRNRRAQRAFAQHAHTRGRPLTVRLSPLWGCSLKKGMYFGIDGALYLYQRSRVLRRKHGSLQ